MAEKKKVNWINWIIGIILIALNLLWIFYLADEIIRDYFIGNEANYSYFVIDWLNILNTVCGLVGIGLAIFLIMEKISPWRALPFNLIIICLSLLINIHVIENIGS